MRGNVRRFKSWCRYLIVECAMAYAVAVALLLIGIFGWFAQEQDPLSAVFLIPMGLPWNLMASSLPDVVLASVAVLAPSINLAILFAICKATSG